MEPMDTAATISSELQNKGPKMHAVITIDRNKRS